MITDFRINNISKFNTPKSTPIQKQNIGNDNVSFSGMPKNVKTGILAGGISVLLLLGYYVKNYLPQNEKQISTEIGWDKNTRILVSNGQNLAGMSHSWGCNSYAKQLTSLLNKNNIQTIEEANDSLAKNGYSIDFREFHPLETPGEKLNIFNKKDQNKKRFVLLISDSENSKFGAISNNFSEEIQKIYNIPKENIVRIITKNKQGFEKAVNKMQGKIDALKSKKNVELLVLYEGHGYAKALTKGAEKIEGAMEGSIFNEFDEAIGEVTESFTESEVKEMFHSKFGKIKTLFILDTCHAGAWIAENSQTNGKKTLNLLSRLA